KPLQRIGELTTDCGHAFHFKCLAQSVQHDNFKCPLCRSDLDSLIDVIIPSHKRSQATVAVACSPEKSVQKWECNRCTFENSSLDALCTVCELGQRPGRDSDPIELTKHQNAQQEAYESFSKFDHTRNTPPSSPSLPPIHENLSAEPEDLELDEKWECNSCEYKNSLSNEKCQMCGAENRNINRETTSSSLTPSDSFESLYSDIATVTPSYSQNRQKEEDEEKYRPRTTHTMSASTTSKFTSETTDYPDQYFTTKKKETPQSPQKQETAKTTVTARGNSLQQTLANVVYAVDLPVELNENEIENAIRASLPNAHQISVVNVKCNLKIGVTTVELKNTADKKKLIDIKTVILAHGPPAQTARFVDEIQLLVYLVIEQKSCSQLEAPSLNEIRHKWNELYHDEESSRDNSTQLLPQLEILTNQFPNIIKAVCLPVSEIVKATEAQVFRLKNGQIVNISVNQCLSYLEDIPSNVDEDLLFCCIATQLNLSEVERIQNSNGCKQKADEAYKALQQNSSLIKLRSSFYIQINPDSKLAVILTSYNDQVTQKWIKMQHVNVKGQPLTRRNEMSLKLVVKPIPKTMSLHTLASHNIFQNCVANITTMGDQAIVELKSKTIYEQCLSRGAIKVDGVNLQIESYKSETALDPSQTTIDSQNWYDTEMLKQKPDIASFNSEHSIFKRKWDAKLWLQHFHRIPNTDRKDFTRRMLRVTVMLNTLSTVRTGKYRLVKDEKESEIVFQRYPMKTVLYTEQSKLFDCQRESISTIKPRFSLTAIEVVNEDCLVAYERLAAEGLNPVLLNMANAVTPGGGYRRGDGAQEENIFRRTNYFVSLDHFLEPDQRHTQNERMKCESNGSLKQLSTNEKMYPVEDFGCIYTSGITIFRKTEANGYEYLSKPIYKVSAIALPAYQAPDLTTDNRLSSKIAVGTRKKIENLFAVAYANNHNCLILSALGCGAFKNPPKHVASIFKTVIEQYAGFFQKIIFAIIDDHNTGGRLNPGGNYIIFRDILDNIKVKPPQQLTPKTTIGPYEITEKSKVKDYIMCNGTPCQSGARCQKLGDDVHCRKYLHPTRCLNGKNCQLLKNKDEDHCLFFMHAIQCKFGGECELLAKNDQEHLNEFLHPDFCSLEGQCTNMSLEHLKKFSHLPLCQCGPQCYKFLTNDREHSKQVRHCKKNCLYGNNCANFHDLEHISNESHPFPTPCPLTPYACSIFIKFQQQNHSSLKSYELEILKLHCVRYSHVCPWGRLCTDHDELHRNNTIHVARKMCPGTIDKCTMLTNDEHLNTYSHTGIRDIRLLCSSSTTECSDRFKKEHCIKYRHGTSEEPLGVTKYFGLNKTISFSRNQKQMIQAIRDHFKNKDIKVPVELQQWIRALQPVHRCNLKIFESILVHGHVMSREYMDYLSKPKFVAQAALQHSRIQRIIDRTKGKTAQKYTQEYVNAIVRKEFNPSRSSVSVPAPAASQLINPVQTTSAQMQSILQPDASDDDEVIDLRTPKQRMSLYFSSNDIEEIYSCTSEIIKASVNLHQKKEGIGHTPDIALETNKHVFSILGPHNGYNYGDIFLVFKRDIMLHPDANFTIQAATTYDSGNAYSWRPWLKNPGNRKEQYKHFHNSKLHCSSNGYDYVVALELMALTGKNKLDDDLKQIIKRWMGADSHQVLEAHLPQLIPLNYIDRIYMPKSVADALSQKSKKYVEAMFGERLQVTDHIMKSPHTTFDSPREKYQKYVNEQLLERLKKRCDKKNNQLYSVPLSGVGTTVSVPGSDFNLKSFILLPLSLKDTYFSTRRPSSSDVVYVYWKALKGDFMFLLTDKPRDARFYLTCYIAPTPSSAQNTHSASELYHSSIHESYSYIHNASPVLHDAILESQLFKAGSNKFHMGCNTNDFIIYCLRFNVQTGDVSLIHVGSNGIYNHSRLQHQFKKQEIDLSQLEYIQIATGSQTVAFQNITIRYEQISELHTSFDQHFDGTNVTSSSSTQNHRDSTATSSPTTHKPTASTSKAQDDSYLMAAIKPLISVYNAFAGQQDTEKRERCRDSHNCLLQYSPNDSKRHNSKYTHPCRFSELCCHIKDKEHSNEYTHEKHNVPNCKRGQQCHDTTNLHHRQQYRHPDLSDFLIPCKDQRECRDKSFLHLQKYSHSSSSTSHHSQHGKYHESSHQTTTSHVHQRSKLDCHYGSDCYNRSEEHRKKYQHPPSTSSPSSFLSHNNSQLTDTSVYSDNDEDDNQQRQSAQQRWQSHHQSHDKDWM
ncbi:unnamed protein product, partial [Didymodactylos carnosus]